MTVADTTEVEGILRQLEAQRDCSIQRDAAATIRYLSAKCASQSATIEALKAERDNIIDALQGAREERDECKRVAIAAESTSARLAERVRELEWSGASLANAAFNISQRDHADAGAIRSLKAAQIAWDRAFKEGGRDAG